MQKQRFSEVLDKLKAIYIQELEDGCNECRGGMLCREHLIIAMDLENNPKKYLGDRLKKGQMPHPPPLKESSSPPGEP